MDKFRILFADSVTEVTYDDPLTVADWLRREKRDTDYFIVLEVAEERREGPIVQGAYRADFWLGRECRQGGCLYHDLNRWHELGGHKPTDKFPKEKR